MTDQASLEQRVQWVTDTYRADKEMQDLVRDLWAIITRPVLESEWYAMEQENRTLKAKLAALEVDRAVAEPVGPTTLY